MGGKASAPAAPDYNGAALTQAAASRELTDVQNWANRPTQNTPFGSVSWNAKQGVDPATGKPITQWTQNTSLAPQLQNALDDQLQIQAGRSDLAQGFMGRVQNEYSQPFNWNDLPQTGSLGRAPTLGAGVGNYSQGLQGGVDPMTQNLQSGFSLRGPQMSMSPMTDGIALGATPQNVDTGFNNLASGIRSGMQTTPINANFRDMTNGIQQNVGNPALNTRFNNFAYGIRSNTNNENVQRSLATGDNPNLPQFDSSYRDTVANQLMQKMQPVHDYQTKQLETKLANQGLRAGSEAYNRAMNQLGNQQSLERFNALDQSGSEAQRLYNMQMGSRQQAFNEDVSGGQFSNAAANQAFNQGLSANQFANQATQQAFNQDLQARQAGNQAKNQQFNQNLASGQFGNSAVQQAYAQALGAQQASNSAQGQLFNQNLQAGQFDNAANRQAFDQQMSATQAANAARGQAFNQDVTNANLRNQALNQRYNQTLGAFNFGNQAQQQAYNQNLGLANLNNQTAQQAFNQNLQAAQFGNQALGQASSLDIARQNANNQALQDQFGLNQQAAQFQNQLRQQAIAEQAQRRGMSLNEMNALLTGQQVGMPQMPSFNPASRAETPNLLGAMQNTYDAQLGAVNAQNAASANTMNGLGSLASTAFMFSDRRLKRNIKRVGEHAIGVGIYEYTMMGIAQRGVIAQEVQAVRPDLVKRHTNGYLMVDYAGMGGL
ncbi:MAG: hypothetical protein RL442_24 [Pseudomonadota bacterium]|jgi:hypothetical protein